jgi:hypothetical protein
MTRASLPFQGFPSALVSGLLYLGGERGVQCTIDSAHIDAGFAQHDAQTRCTTTRMRQDPILHFHQVDLDFANDSSARSHLNGTKAKCPSNSIPTKQIL